MKKILIVFGLLVLFAVTASATTGYVDPNGDDNIEWDWGVAGLLYTDINTGIRNNGTPSGGGIDAIEGNGADADFNMTTLTGVDSVSAVTLWVYGMTAGDGSLNAQIYIGPNGWSSDTQEIMPESSSWGWYSIGTAGLGGDPWSQSDLDNLKIRLTHYASAGGSYVASAYVEITYTEAVPEFFGIHFEWFDLSSGLIAAALAIALPMILFKRKKNTN